MTGDGVDDDLADMTPEDWVELEAELRELEATDPGVAAAAAGFERASWRIVSGRLRGRRLSDRFRRDR